MGVYGFTMESKSFWIGYDSPAGEKEDGKDVPRAAAGETHR